MDHGHVGSNRTYLQSNPLKCTVLVLRIYLGRLSPYPCSILYLVARVQIAAATLSGNSFRQTVHTHHASVHQAAELVAALFRVVGVTAGLAEK